MSKIYNVKPDCFREEGTLKVTSHFGKRTDPVTGEENVTHAGVDCVRYKGGSNLATITAMADGTVIKCHWGEEEGKEYTTARGNYVKIDHGNGICTLYQHLKNTTTVETGDKVKKGDVIGHMGNTGKSAGAHLHIEVHLDGKVVDPLPYLIGEKAIEGNAFLCRGDVCENVKTLQAALVSLGYSCGDSGVDGSFGPATEIAVKNYQTDNGHAVTGVLTEEQFNEITDKYAQLKEDDFEHIQGDIELELEKIEEDMKDEPTQNVFVKIIMKLLDIVKTLINKNK